MWCPLLDLRSEETQDRAVVFFEDALKDVDLPTTKQQSLFEIVDSTADLFLAQENLF
jgi:hypothetical protein